MRHRIVVLSVLVLVSACIDGDDSGIEGSGNVIVEAREVGDFDRISVEGFGVVRVEVGPAPSLTVEAEDNVVPLLVTEVEGTTLELKVKPGTSFRHVEEPLYTITTPTLAGVSISGSGDVTITGLDSESFDAAISGSGDIRPSGTTSSLDVSIGGSGAFHGGDLVATSAEVSVSGSGSVVVEATDTLDVAISGSGDVRYLGDPVLTPSISGSGSIERG